MGYGTARSGHLTCNERKQKGSNPLLVHQYYWSECRNWYRRWAVTPFLFGESRFESLLLHQYSQGWEKPVTEVIY